MRRENRTAEFLAHIDALGEGRPLMLAEIIRAVAHASGLTRAEVMGRCRHKSVVSARQAGMWIAQRGTRRSLPEIGRAFGGRDHTTVLHGVRKVAARLAEGDEGFGELIFFTLEALALRPLRLFESVEPALPMKTLMRTLPERTPKSDSADRGDFTAPHGSRPWFTANERRFQAGFIAAHPELVSETLRDTSGDAGLSISFVGAS